jgi:hypothetical protein
MNYTMVVFAIVLCLLSFSGGWKANSWKNDSERLLEVEAQKQALEATAEAIAKIDVRNTTIKQKVVEYVTEKPVYVDCKHDDDGMRLVNEAITGKSAADPKLSGTVAVDE